MWFYNFLIYQLSKEEQIQIIYIFQVRLTFIQFWNQDEFEFLKKILKIFDSDKYYLFSNKSFYLLDLYDFVFVTIIIYVPFPE